MIIIKSNKLEVDRRIRELMDMRQNESLFCAV